MLKSLELTAAFFLCLAGCAAPPVEGRADKAQKMRAAFTLIPLDVTKVSDNKVLIRATLRNETEQDQCYWEVNGRILGSESITSPDGQQLVSTHESYIYIAPGDKKGYGGIETAKKHMLHAGETTVVGSTFDEPLDSVYERAIGEFGKNYRRHDLLHYVLSIKALECASDEFSWERATFVDSSGGIDVKF